MNNKRKKQEVEKIIELLKNISPTSVNLLEASAETRLWRSVVKQALEDLTDNSVYKKNRRYRRLAAGWIFGNYEGFEEVCLRAALSPDFVRDTARRAMKAGRKWRRKSAVFHTRKRAIN